MPSTSEVDVWNRALGRIHQTQQVQNKDETTEAAKACVLHYGDVLDQVLRVHPWKWAMREMVLTAINSQSSTKLQLELVSPYDTFNVPFAFINTTQVVVVHIDSADDETTLVAGTDYSFNDTDPVTITLDTALDTDEKVRVTVTTSRVGWGQVYTLPADYVRAGALLPAGARYSQISVDNRLEFEVMLSDDGIGSILVTNETSLTFAAFAYVARASQVRTMPRDFLSVVIWRLAAELADALTKDPKRAIYCMRMYEYELQIAIDTNEAEGHNRQQAPQGVSARGAGRGWGGAGGVLGLYGDPENWGAPSG